MLPGVYPSDNHIYRTTVQFRRVEVMMMHTAVTVAANSLDAHESPGRQAMEDIWGPSEAGVGLGHPGPKASQPYWILEPLQKFHRQFLRIPAF